MVPTKNLTSEQLHEPLSSFFNSTCFDKDRKTLSQRPMVLGNTLDVDEKKDNEEREEVGTNPNPKDWLQLGATSSQEIRKGNPIELELFANKPSCQEQKQMIIGTSKRQRHAMWGPVGRSSWGPVTEVEYFRVVTPPRRPEAGVWLVLSAARNQLKELLLPQIERSYLRIKDCNMTVRLLMKYLANKLGLRNESEATKVVQLHEEIDVSERDSHNASDPSRYIY